MNEAIDYSTLRWVKQELDETLKQARQALEAYVETPEDEAQIGFCATHLHQVYGTLQMVQLYGAALLAEEMEQVAKALVAGAIKQPDDAFGVLMRSMLQLPDYLERLTGGGRDIPMVLLPLLNDLRAVRGENLLSENAMFSPDLSRTMPEQFHGVVDEDLQGLAKSLRHQYQIGLLAWYRDHNAEQGMDKIGEVLDRLQAAAGAEAVARLWWLSGGLVDALRAGALDVSLSSKLLLGQVDRQIKQLIDSGEAALESAPPVELIKNLLFYVARAKGGSDRVVAIKDVYGLDALLPEDNEVAAARESLSGHNLDLLQTVSVAIKENLARVKDGLDLFQRGGAEQTELLEPVAETLKSLGDTLGMLGMGAPRKVVLEKAEITREIIAGTRAASESELMDIAGALLEVENAVDGAASGTEVQAETAEEAEFDQVMVVVLQEAITDMARAKEAIGNFMETADTNALQTVPQLFNQVKGGLLLLGREKAAALVHAVNGYIGKELLHAEQVPDADTLDTLADAICGIEYYLEGQKEKRMFGASVIDVAVQAVEQLGYPLDADMAAEMTAVEDGGDVEPEACTDDAAAAFEFDSQEVEEISLEAPLPDAQEPSEQETAAQTPDAIVIEDESGATEFASTDTAVAADPASPAAAETDIQVVGPDIDDEILEIFIEESEEELATLQELLPRWIDNLEDEEALITVRRSFHTLKGSGRLVGANIIGEFAWAFENLLNRVIDGRIDPEETMYGLLRAALQVLPDLVEQVKGGPASRLDVALLGAQAEALGRGEPIDLAVVESAVATSANEEAFVPAPLLAAETPAGAVDEADDTVMDPVLYDIFYAETEAHLRVIRAFLSACNEHDGDCAVSEDLVRALHTLHGSARMAQAEGVAEIASALEVYAKSLMAEQVAMPDAGVEATEDGANVVELILELLRHEAPEMPDLQPLLARIDALPSNLDALEQAMEVGDQGDTLADLGLSTPEEEPIAVDAEPMAETVPLDLSADHPAAVSGEVDPEILEVFLEEAEEELRVIAEMLPRWIANTEDDEAQVTLRRSFHTLKGSGRLVGALSLGEFAWAFENLLNRVIDGVIAADANVLNLLREAGECLPQLYDQAKDGSTPACDTLFLQERAHALSRGELEPAAEPAPVEAQMPETIPEAQPPAPVQETDSVPANDPYADVDPELLQIFLEEADEILASGEETLQGWSEAPEDGALMAEYQRQLHTLKGGARMAEITAIGDLSHGVETVLTAVVEGQAAVDKRMLDLLQLAHDRLTTMVEQVHQHQRAEPAQGLLDEFEAWWHDSRRQGAPESAVLEEAAAVAVENVYSEADPELLEIFLEEGDEILEASEATLLRWSEAPDNFDLMAQYQRELHTLKGGARMANIVAIGDLAHRVETLVAAFAEAKKIPPKPVFDALQVAQDRLLSLHGHVRKQEALEDAHGLIAELHSLLPGGAQVDEQALEQVIDADAAAAGDERRAAPRGRQELVRVRADLLDNLVNYAGEISIYRARLEQQVGAYRFNLTEMDQTVERLRAQLRQLEIETEAQILSGHQEQMDQYGEHFDPLEMDRYSTLQQLSRSLAESVGDLSSIQSLLYSVTRESETLLLQQSRVNTELQEGLMRTRMVPFLGLAPRMRRIVRQTCQTLGKQAELKLEGAEGEMDRTVIDRMIAPLEHMLRNAISHGIETTEQRIAAGKPADGSICVSMAREASEVVIRIEDDGAGIELESVRSKAIERGLMRPDLPLSDNEVLQFILETGFSTAAQVTQVSGRGVGMDVVNSEVKQLGGSLHIDSTAGQGSCFTIRLPFTLAINQALLITAGEDRYAIPLSSIEGIVRMRREELLGFYDDPMTRFEYAGYEYELQHLGSLLGVGSLQRDALPRRVPVLLARSGEHCVAMHVDQLMGSREIVVKSVGPQISSVPGVSGATILGDGSVVLILELAPLLRMGSLQPAFSPEETTQAEVRSGVTVMVVDDSITVRKVTTRLLNRHGMEVIAAKDGVDAVAQLQEHMPDVMLLDIEMPRMDGFEVATHVRNDARLRDLPIIMITSRTGDKHRNRAMEIGVNRYLGKPFQEAELLDNIEGLLAEQQQHGG